MQIDEVEELFPAHPSGQNHHKRHIHQLHRIGCFVEASLLNPEMILLTVFMTLNREASDSAFKYLVADFPALVFVEFMQCLDDGSLSVGEILNFNDFSENPASFRMFAIDELILLYLFFLYDFSVIEVVIDESVKVDH